MRKPWAVLVLNYSLQSDRPVYHEYGGSPGTTACGRRWYITMRIEKDSSQAAWVRRANAEKFARLCGHCKASGVEGLCRPTASVIF